MSGSGPRRLLRALGFFPLWTFTLWHLWEHTPVGAGREEVLARLSLRLDGLPAAAEGVGLLLPLAVHVGVGLSLWVLARGRGASDGLRRNQRGAAVVLAAFLAWHLGTLWGPARLGEGALAALARAEAQLDTLPGSLSFALGWTALAVHAGLGLARVLGGDGPPSLAASGVALSAAVFTWLWGVNVLAGYVAGASLW